MSESISVLMPEIVNGISPPNNYDTLSHVFGSRENVINSIQANAKKITVGTINLGSYNWTTTIDNGIGWTNQPKEKIAESLRMNISTSDKGTFGAGASTAHFKYTTDPRNATTVWLALTNDNLFHAYESTWGTDKNPYQINIREISSKPFLEKVGKYQKNNNVFIFNKTNSQTKTLNFEFADLLNLSLPPTSNVEIEVQIKHTLDSLKERKVKLNGRKAYIKSFNPKTFEFNNTEIKCRNQEGKLVEGIICDLHVHLFIANYAYENELVRLDENLEKILPHSGFCDYDSFVFLPYNKTPVLERLTNSPSLFLPKGRNIFNRCWKSNLKYDTQPMHHSKSGFKLSKNKYTTKSENKSYDIMSRSQIITEIYVKEAKNHDAIFHLDNRVFTPNRFFSVSSSTFDNAIDFLDCIANSAKNQFPELVKEFNNEVSKIYPKVEDDVAPLNVNLTINKEIVYLLDEQGKQVQTKDWKAGKTLIGHRFVDGDSRPVTGWKPFERIGVEINEQWDEIRLTLSPYIEANTGKRVDEETWKNLPKGTRYPQHRIRGTDDKGRVFWLSQRPNLPKSENRKFNGRTETRGLSKSLKEEGMELWDLEDDQNIYLILGPGDKIKFNKHQEDLKLCFNEKYSTKEFRDKLQENLQKAGEIGITKSQYDFKEIQLNDPFKEFGKKRYLINVFAHVVMNNILIRKYLSETRKKIILEKSEDSNELETKIDRLPEDLEGLKTMLKSPIDNT